MNRPKNDIEQLFRQEYSKLHHYAMQMVSDGELCRDIIADAFEQLWLQYDAIAEDKRVAVLYRTVHNRCIDNIRKTLVHQRYVSFFQNLFAPGSDGSSAAEPDYLRREKIDRAVEHLPDTDRRIVERAFTEGRHYAEIAEEMGISISAIKKRVAKAILKIREECREDG